MKKLSFVLLLTLFSCSAMATDGQAKSLLDRLSNSIQKLNFSTSFVVVKNNQAEPYHWYHGLNDAGVEFEILSLLNGPRRDILRKNNIVSYIEPELHPYSILADNITGPIPLVFSNDISRLDNSYDYISVGKSRVLGRLAQIVRIVSKDQHRYGHWLWLDEETGLLLKMALITRTGQLLEQIQFTHLEITAEFSDSLKQLENAELPHVVNLPENKVEDNFSWQVNWLPAGFEALKSDRHRIAVTKQPVEFMLFHDGLVNVSVYVGPSNDNQRAMAFVRNGATVVLNQVINGREISVVGKIPEATAKAIADSITFKVKTSP